MTLSHEDLHFVRRLIHEEAGLAIEPDKDYLVKARLRRLAADRGAANMTDLVEQARSSGDHDVRQAIAEAMTIQETYFFRDPWLWTALRENVLPALIRARRQEQALRIWCGASATGQEIYSLCLLLEEHFPEVRDWQLEIVATDISPTALAYARDGVYSQMEVNRGLPAALLLRHFQREGLRWRISPRIGRRIQFRQLNLVGAWPALPTFDLVLLRNVLIYFDFATRHDVLSRLRLQMRRDGYLFMGGSESPLGVSNDFCAGDDGHACYYRPLQSELRHEPRPAT